MKVVITKASRRQLIQRRHLARATKRARLTETDIVELAKQALIIEEHYGTPMDIEWGKDGSTGKIYILQARPETVQSRAGRTIQRYTLKSRGKVLVTGRSIGQRIGAGHARVIKDVKEMSRVRAGDVLVADMTDPDWEPVMKRASAIVTNRGGRTCHAAIIARAVQFRVARAGSCGDAETATWWPGLGPRARTREDRRCGRQRGLGGTAAGDAARRLRGRPALRPLHRSPWALPHDGDRRDGGVRAVGEQGGGQGIREFGGGQVYGGQIAAITDGTDHIDGGGLRGRKILPLKTEVVGVAVDVDDGKGRDGETETVDAAINV